MINEIKEDLYIHERIKIVYKQMNELEENSNKQLNEIRKIV
jgi:hypothetical protein